MGSLKELTEDEAALYDRQIRLWGLDAQQRMQSSKLLVIHVGGISTETCKNLVLAGVGSITLMDHHVVTQQDLATQFFFSDASVGENKAEASIGGLSLLNPRVQLTIDKQPLEEKTEDFFASFNLVCLTGGTKAQISKINDICRKKGVKFIAALTHGLFGLIFCDLLQHTYVEERKQPVAGKKDEVETVVTQKVEEYCSFEQAWGKKWTTTPFKRQKRVSPALFAFQVLLAFEAEHQRLPGKDDLSLLQESRAKHFSHIDADVRALEDPFLKTFLGHVGAEIAPITAILGGLVAQEVIKVLSGKDLPVNNFFVFEGPVGVGSVETLA